MISIVPCQLPSFFALLYKLITIEEIKYDKPSPITAEKKNFKQILKFPDGTKTINYLPPCTAPYSTIKFWCDQLQIKDNQIINSYVNQGYSSIDQVMADVNGLYEYYINPRFVICYNIFIYNLLLFYIYFIYILLYFYTEIN